MNKEEYIEHKLNKQKDYYAQAQKKQGYFHTDTDPRFNPQMADMLRHEMKHGRIQGEDKRWNPYGGKIPGPKHPDFPKHNARKTQRWYRHSLNEADRDRLDKYNKATGFNPKKGSLADVQNRRAVAVKGVHYGGKPKIDTAYKTHYTQEMYDELIQNPYKRYTEIIRSKHYSLKDKELAAKNINQLKVKSKEFHDYQRSIGGPRLKGDL